MKILRILIAATAIAGLASSCSSGSTKTITTIAEAESSPQVTNSYQSSSSSSNSDAKVFEPSSRTTGPATTDGLMEQEPLPRWARVMTPHLTVSSVHQVQMSTVHSV